MQSTIHQLGVGFNPRYLKSELPLPEPCVYIEAGKSLFHNQNALSSLSKPGRSFSLHLARVPFCEPTEIQQAFIDCTLATLSPMVESLGLHLCGPYQGGLGSFGLGNSFFYTQETVRRSRRFLDLLCNATERKILLENANFYDCDRQQAIQTIEFTNQLCTEYNARLILDLAHLLINAKNLGLPPSYLLGLVNLDLVEVIHLSGVVEGRDGVLHDGHTLPVHPAVWHLLETVLSLLTHPVILVLEHTDSCWANQKDSFLADWHKMEQLVNNRETVSQRRQPIDVKQAGIGYMANIVLPQRCPQIYALLGQERFTQIARAWGRHFLARIEMHSEAYVAIGQADYLDYTGHLVDPVADFLEFLKIGFHQKAEA